jgi:hypothetical protein
MKRATHGGKRGSGKKRAGKRREQSGSTAERGAERLKEAVDRKLKKNSGMLADLLLAKAREGDLASLRLLVSLAENHKPKEPVVDPGPLRSQALLWAAEPQWVDPEEEELKGEDREMIRGGRSASDLPFSEPD